MTESEKAFQKWYASLPCAKDINNWNFPSSKEGWDAAIEYMESKCCDNCRYQSDESTEWCENCRYFYSVYNDNFEDPEAKEFQRGIEETLNGTQNDLERILKASLKK